MATRFCIKHVRLRRGLTQVELAQRSGVPQWTISRLETGRVRVLDLDTLDKIARALKVKSVALLS